MKQTYKILLFGLILGACDNDIMVSEPIPAEDISYADHPKNELYQTSLKNYREETNSPGSVLLIDRVGEPLWIGTEGFSNLSYQEEFKSEGLFRTGSITKMFVAVAILQLVEAEKLNLEDKLADLLPFTVGNIPSPELITVRHLLAHMSGIVDPPNESLQYQAEILDNPSGMYDASMQDIYEKYVFGKSLNFNPGERYAYSNTNYWLLADIAEARTGKSLQELMEEGIFNPLGLTKTYLLKSDDRSVARGYSDMYGNGVLYDVSIYDRAEGDGKGDGGLISTASDLQRFMRGLFSGELISAELLEEMTTIQWSACDSYECEYGLGMEIWRTEAGIAYGHNGSLVGIEVNALYYEETGNISVLYKNNGNGSDKSWLGDLMK